MRVEDVAGDEAFLDPDLAPVVGGVGVLAQDTDLFSRQRAVLFMKCGAHCLYIYKSTPQMYRLSYKRLPSMAYPSEHASTTRQAPIDTQTPVAALRPLLA